VVCRRTNGAAARDLELVHRTAIPFVAASWRHLLLRLIYGPVRLRAAGDSTDPVSAARKRQDKRQNVTQEIQSLASLRTELDQIDDDILSLIERRLEVSSAIARSKEMEGDRHLKIRPRRQAEVLERLRARATDAPAELVGEVWRALMAHSLQAQARTEIVLAPSDNPELLEARVRAHFGSAAPLSWATSPSHAIRQALGGEAIAILPQPLSSMTGDLRVFDVLCDEAGQPVAYAAGRVAPEDSLEALPERTKPLAEARSAAIDPKSWTPESWRAHPAQQLPEYADCAALSRVERRLAGSTPLVSVADIIHLRASLARVAAGDGFLLQGGDCFRYWVQRYQHVYCVSLRQHGL